jgi:5S rRNA maturation endonuclease (ribonuclease M5)
MSIFREYINSKKTLTEKLLDEITDFDIYCELIGMDLELGQSIESPIRTDDTRASFSLYVPTKVKDVRPDEVWWKDFAGGFGDVFKFVQKYVKLHYGEDLTNRYEIIKFLDAHFSLGIFGGEKKTYIKREVDFEAARETKEILFSSRKYTKRDLIWWLQFGIDEALLRKHDVRSVEHLLDEDFTIKYTFKRMELAFAYVVYDKIKLYCPEETDFKWRNTCPADYLLGEQQIEGHDVLIVTKSLKDIMSMKSFIKADIISPQSETWIFPQELIDKIKLKYKKYYVVMDYDNAGIEAANRLEKHGFIVKWVSKKQVIINDKLVVVDKDMSDYVKNNGYQKSLKRVMEMFNELDKSYFRLARPQVLESMLQKLVA